jgi:oxygen-independent coproporphyrinogen-3 oxidase
MNTQPDRATVVDLLRKYDRPGPRYTSYPTAPMWNDSVDSQVYRTLLEEASKNSDTPLAVYCHIPFCRKRCYYCGCNTCIAVRRDPIDKYLSSMEREIAAVARLLDKRRRVSQLHLGGGTPTFLGVDGLTKLMRMLSDRFPTVEDAEVSIEVDPRETSADDIPELQRLGFNRVSLGVQSFNSDVQSAIGRNQTTEQVEHLYSALRQHGFGGINFDLIYGLPLQIPERFDGTLDKTIELRPDRIALYSFAYLPNLPRLRGHQRLINPDDLPDTETKYRLFSTAIDRLTAAGYRQIGMDHFALPEDELSRAQQDGRLHRNFMGYTVQAAPEMIGFGMSGIGYVNNAFVQNMSEVPGYREAVDKDGLAVYRGLKLSDDDLIRRFVIGSLMCNFKLSFEELEQRFGVSYGDYFAAEDERLTELIEDRLLERQEDSLQVTPLGRTFVRNIAMTFDAWLAHKDEKTTFSRTI